MKLSLEQVKTRISGLADRINGAGESTYEWMPYETSIVELIIEYSCQNGIAIPLVDYDSFRKRNEPEAEEPSMPPSKRRKLKDDDSDPVKYTWKDQFFDAIAESHLKAPRFHLHPEIQELVDHWTNALNIDKND